MPFDRNGIWKQPTEADKELFLKQLNAKNSEIAPTPEMIQAIASEISKDNPVSEAPRRDLFNAISNLAGGADIIIPIYDGLHVLKPCIESIVNRTKWAYKLILVNDCSPDPEIRKYLRTLSSLYPNLNWGIIHNKKNRGFAASVNRGVAAGKNPYICILNSDTIVTNEWLTKILMALEADPKNAIVNPVTNNTALVNVPMYNGCSYLDMADAISIAPNTLTYNEIMPTGFCFTIRRSLWNQIGPFDEAYTRGYGEETDFWQKAIKQTDKENVILKNRAVIADNAYIFHERGTSFSQLSTDEHMGFRRAGSERFHQLHPDFASWRQGFDELEAINHLRNELPKFAFKKQYKGNIAWVVKSAGPCGGMNFIADIVNQLIEEGYNAKVCVIPEKYDEENPNLQVVGNLRTSPILFKTPEEFTSTFTQRVFTKGKVLAAVAEITPYVWDLTKIHKGIEGYNHVQSYDVFLAKALGKIDLMKAFKESYKRLPNIVSSEWIAKTLIKDGCEVKDVILPGLNPDIFHPRNREDGDERFTIAILIDKQYLFKGADWAYEFLKALQPEKKSELRVLAIGPTSLKDIRGVTCLGSLSISKMANLLGAEIDMLVDPAGIHSYGLPALEALYSGCAVLTRQNKGINEYMHLWNNKVLIENDPIKAANKALDFWYKNPNWERTFEIDEKTNRDINIRKFINSLFPKIEIKKHKIEVITPHLRKHGGPTTIISAANQIMALGHNVSMSTIYSDWNPEVLNMAKDIKIRVGWETIPESTELIIINSDNPFAQQIMERFPDKKYIMLKLSHNPRFKVIENDNLNLNWDHIITSTEWLRNVCLTPLIGEGWNHQSWDPNKVKVVGWQHYGHKLFNMPPTNRTYGNAEVGFRLGTLIHAHPLKGTNEAMKVIDALKRKYEINFHAIGFGEAKAKLPQHMQYIKNANRKNMAHIFKQIDIWFGASYSEGLGRMALEAMSAGMAVVTTDTGAEFLKDGENCLLYKIGDMQSGAEAVDKLVNDTELFTKIVVNGHATAEKAANPNNFRKNLNTVIREVLK